MFEQFTYEIVELIESLPVFSVYLVFFLIAYLENVIPPIPGDVLVAFGGYLAYEGLVSFSMVLGITTVASVLGFMSMYALGSYWGSEINIQQQRFWLFKYLEIRYMHRAQSWMGRWGQGVVLANRFLAGTRSVISLMAGISHMPVKLTILNATISSLIWNSILIGLGWFIRENWDRIGSYLSVYSRIILLLLAVFVAVRVSIYYYEKRKYTRSKDKSISNDN